jgi:hypothetical protein
VALFSAADTQEFQFLKAELAYADEYRLFADGAVVQDGQGNSLAGESEIEAGWCRLLTRDLQASERVVADRLNWETAYVIEAPMDTIAAPEHRLRIGSREFFIGSVSKGGGGSVDATILAEERGL